MAHKLPLTFILLILLLSFCRGLVLDRQRHARPSQHFRLWLWSPKVANLTGHGFGSANAQEKKSSIENQIAFELEIVLSKKAIRVTSAQLIDLSSHDREDGTDRPPPSVSFQLYVRLNQSISGDQLRQCFSAKEQIVLFKISPFEFSQIPASDVDRKIHFLYPTLFSSLRSGSGPKCLNNGVLLPNGTCVCKNYFAGADCSRQLCLHSGILSRDTSYACSCPPGYIGRHCESMPCLPQVDENVDHERRSLVLVLSIRDSMAFDLTQLIERLHKFVNEDARFKSGYYANFVLTTFLGKGSLRHIRTEMLSSPAQLLESLQDVVLGTGNPNQPTIGALLSAIQSVPQMEPKSDVFLLTDSASEEVHQDQSISESASDSLEGRAAKALVHWQLSLFALLSNSRAHLRPSPLAQGTQVYKRLAHLSNGEFIDLDMNKSLVDSLLDNLLSAQFRPETVAVRRDWDCSLSDTSLLDGSGPAFVYMSSQSPAQLFYRESVYSAYKQQKPTAVFGSFSIFKLIGSSGSIMISAARKGSQCSYRLFVQSTRTAFVAFGDTKEVDAGASTASSKMPLFASVLPVFTSRKLVRSISIKIGPLSNPNGMPFFTDYDVRLRPGQCNFPFQTSRTLKCSPPGPIVSTVTVKLGGFWSGESFTRAIPSMCYQTSAPIRPMPTCQNGGRRNPYSGKCQCPPFFSGPLCEKAECVNGGQPELFPGNKRPICNCADGYSGRHCQLLSCPVSAPRPDLSRRALALVVQASFSQAHVNAKLVEALTGMAAQRVLEKGGGIFDAFVLTTVQAQPRNASGPNITVRQFDSLLQLRDAVQQIPYKYSSPGVRWDMLEAISLTLGRPQLVHPLRPLLFVVTDSPAPDDSLSRRAIRVGIHNKLATVGVVLTQPFGPDGPGECPLTVGDLQFFREFSLETGGAFLDLCSIGANGGPAVANINQHILTFLTQFTLNQVRHHTVDQVGPVNFALDWPFRVRDSTPTRNFIVQSDGPAQFSVQLLSPRKGDSPRLTVQLAAPSLQLLRADKLQSGVNYTLRVSPIAGQKKSQINFVLRVDEPSAQKMVLGFSRTPAIDLNSQTLAYGHPSHPVLFTSTQLQSQVRISANIPSVDGQHYSALAKPRQSNCHFDYFFPSRFACPGNGSGVFQTKLHLEADDGSVALDRLFHSLCVAPAIGHCLNGGSFDIPASACRCPDDFHGPVCERPTCRNGGVVSQAGCQCPSGFGGQFCENVLCSSWDFLSAFDSAPNEAGSVAFVVQNSVDSVDTLKGLIAGLRTFLTRIYRHNEGPRQLTLVTFDAEDSDPVISTAHPERFLAQFKATLSALSPNRESKSAGKALEAIGEALKLASSGPATVFAFVDGDTMLPTQSEQREVWDELARGNVQVNVLLANRKFPTPPDPRSGNFAQYLHLTMGSNGRHLLFGQQNTQTLLESVLPFAVRENVFFEDFFARDCSSSIQELVWPLGARDQLVSIYIRGRLDQDKLRVWDGNLTEMTNLTGFRVFSDPASSVLHLKKEDMELDSWVGRWRLWFRTFSGSCHVQVRGQSALTIALGFTPDSHSDFVSKTPAFATASGRSFVTVQARDGKGVHSAGVIPQRVEIWTRNVVAGGGHQLAAADLTRRGGGGEGKAGNCANQFLSPLVHLAPGKNLPNETASAGGPPLWPKDQPLYVRVKGWTDFSRMHFFVPRKIDCQNGSPNADSGVCDCPPGYGGIDCAVPVCHNGGMADKTICNCPTGYFGHFCENVVI